MQLQAPVYLVICAFIIGLVMGSFLNCWARRIVYGESIVHGRSHCTSCNHVLAPLDLIPIASWLALRGACRYCGTRISVRYPIVELVCAVVYASIVACYGITLEAVELLCFSSVLLVLSLTDIDVYIIPNGCIVAAVAIRATYLVVAGGAGSLDLLQAVAESVLGGVVVLVPMVIVVLMTDRIIGRPSLGGGDLKLLFVAGLYFGWQQCLVLIVIACVLGLVTAFFGAIEQKSEGEGRLLKKIPFGPSLAVACWVIMLCGQALASLIF